MTFKTAEQAATAIFALNGTRFQGRMLHLTPAEAENHPRGGLQRDATAEETLRRSGQCQGYTKGDISGPRSHNEAMLAETKTTGESGRTLGRKPSHSATDKNTGVGLKWDATAGETPRRGGQSQGNTKAEPSTPKSNYEATMAETKRIQESGRTPISNLGYSDTKKDATAKEGSPRPNGQAKGKPTETQTIEEPDRFFVANLNYSTTEEDIGTLFGKFGPVTIISVPTDQKTGKRKELAFVTLTTPKHAVAAISALLGEKFQGRQ